MPWTVRKGSGDRPWKIVKADTGEIVGSSTSEEMAKKAVAARYVHEKMYKGGIVQKSKEKY